MSDQATELLDSISEDIPESEGNSVGEEHIIVGRDRYIKVPDSLKRIAVQHDHNIETVTFDCPRYWDGHDLSTMYIFINCEMANRTKGLFLADNITVDEADADIIHFTWTITRAVTSIEGNISFLVCAKESDQETGEEVLHWNSEINTEMRVSKGLEASEAVVEEHNDIITSLMVRMDKLEFAAGNTITQAMDGPNGVLVVPGDGGTYLTDKNLDITNVLTQGDISVDENGNAEISGDVKAKNAEFTGDISAENAEFTNGTFSGDISASDITASGTVKGKNGDFAGNVTVNNALTAAAITASGNIKGGSGTFTGDATVNGTLTSGSIKSGSGTFTGDVSSKNGTFTGNVKGGSGTFTGDVSSKNGTFTGNVSGVNGSFTGNIDAANMHASSKITVGADKDEVDVPKIGDVKITGRTITDDKWLLCDNTYATKSAYPKLYEALKDTFKMNIFGSGVWNEWKLINGGFAPRLCADGYLYFFSTHDATNEVSSIRRCKPDYSGMETYALPDSGYLYYVDGYFFLFTNDANNSIVYHVYSSKDGFKTYTEVTSSSPFQFMDRYAYNYVYTHNNTWYIVGCDKEGVSVYKAAGPEGSYDHIVQIKDFISSTYNGVKVYGPSCYSYKFSNGSSLHYLFSVQVDPSSSTSVKKKYFWIYNNQVLLFNPYTPLSNCKPISIPELDIVFQAQYMFTKDGKCTEVPAIEALGSSYSGLDISHCGDYLYFKLAGGNIVTRVKTSDIAGDYETVQNTDWKYPLSSFSGKLIMPKDESNIYYIDNFETLCIPSAIPNTPYKTYIKAK